MKEGRRGGDDNAVGTKAIDGGLTSFDGSREIGLPDVTARNETKREEEGSGLNSGDGGFKLSRSTVEVDVETGNWELGGEAEVE